ncbi:MAG TPA: hypothetical protein VNJ04_05185 [Gemmatimonadaceae bacterium]|nr:hypothetical protein [Gemmatimonadaceae bacterium]
MSNAIALASMKDFAAKLRDLPTVVAIKVATAAAPILTEMLRETFEASSDAYGNAWAPGAEGQIVKLQKSGATAKTVRFVATGTKLRVALGTSYIKYHLGKRPITPRNGELPVKYGQALADVTQKIATEALAS